MRKLLAVMLVLLLVPAAVGDAKKFSVTYSITFNSLTLTEAGAKERAIRELFDDACKVDVVVADVGQDWHGTISDAADTMGMGRTIADSIDTSRWGDGRIIWVED